MTTTTAQQRSDEAAELLAELGVTGRVELVTLDDDEELVLGGGLWALGDAAAWRGFTARPLEERERAAAGVRRALLDSGRATTVDGHPTEVAFSPALGLVAAARLHADFLVVARTPDGTRPQALPFGYALADDTHGLRGVVVELRTPGRHDYRLCSVARAAGGFADWALRAVTTEEWGARYDEVVLEVLRADPGGSVAAGLVVRPDGSGAALLLDGRRRRVAAGDRDALVATVEDMIQQAADRGRGAQR